MKIKMRFLRGDLVETSSQEEGFIGSYYLATVLTNLKENTYLIEYRTLLSDDETKSLRDVVSDDTMRPCPPEIRASGFSLRQIVDVYANDGWWVGMVTKRAGLMCSVYFESTNEEIEYPGYRLRVHQELVDGKWVVSGKKI